MQAPPPYIPAAPKKKTGLIIAIVLGVLFVCCGLPLIAVVGGGFFAFGQAKGTVGCTISFGVVRAAIDDYVADHNGKLPPAATWQDAVRPYYAKKLKSKKDGGNDRESEQVLSMLQVMPADGEWGCTEDKTKTGIAFNSTLGGKKLAEIKDRSTVLIFEVPQRAKNLNMPFKTLDHDSSPKIFGKHRGWISMGLDGDNIKMGSKGNFNFDTSSSSDSK